jgi:hypothetical protein
MESLDLIFICNGIALQFMTLFEPYIKKSLLYVVYYIDKATAFWLQIRKIIQRLGFVIGKPIQLVRLISESKSLQLNLSYTILTDISFL